MRYINGTKHLTPTEAARALGVPRAYVLTAIRERKLRAHWNRYRLYIPELELERYLEEHLNQSADRVARRLLRAMGVRTRLVFSWHN